MGQIDSLCRRVSVADLTLMVLVEDFSGSGRGATPGTLSAAINGAPIDSVRRLLDQLVASGALNRAGNNTYEVTPLGAEVLERSVQDWEPEPSQHERREAELARAARIRL